MEVFIAEHSILAGEELSSTIEEAVDSCDLFVLLWSQQAESSKWVPIELGQAKGRRKPILPIVLHKNVPIPPFISGLKYIDATENPEAAFREARRVILHHVRKKFPELAELRKSMASSESGSGWHDLLFMGIGAFLLWAFTRE